MQICEWINDRSIFSYLISMRSWLIVLLLNNYPEFTQGLESRALGCGSFFCFASSLWPLETGLSPNWSILTVSVAVNLLGYDCPRDKQIPRRCRDAPRSDRGVVTLGLAGRQAVHMLWSWLWSSEAIGGNEEMVGRVSWRDSLWEAWLDTVPQREPGTILLRGNILLASTLKV